MEQLTWRILLVDDDDEDYLITRSLLNQARGRKVNLDWAPTYAAGMVNLQTIPYDAALVDYDLGINTGIELIREMVAWGYSAPLILYTGRGNYEVDIEAMQAGAALYLTKGEAGPLMLERAIRYAIERKQVEEAVRESRENYRQLFDSMLDGFALHEMLFTPQGEPLDYRFLEVNPAFEELTGLKAVDILEKTVLEVLPDIEPYWIETYGEVARTGRSIRFENYSQALGKYYEVVAFSPRQNQFAVIFTDISVRRKAEQALLSAQEQLEQRVQERTQELKTANEILETIFSGIHHPIALLDREFNFIRVNENYARANRCDPAFFVGKNHFKLYPNDENEAIFRRVVETGEPYSVHARPFQYPEHRETGVTYWDWHLHPIKEENGFVSGLLLALWDVTEHQETEARLKQVAARAEAALEMFEGIFQAVPGAVLLVGSDGKIVCINRQAERTFGHLQGELIGRPVETLLPERHQALHPAALHSASTDARSNRIVAQESPYTCRRKDGQEISGELFINPVQIRNQLYTLYVFRENP